MRFGFKGETQAMFLPIYAIATPGGDRNTLAV